MEELYNTIFKRKSIRKFDNNLYVNTDELKQINDKMKNIKVLCNNIKVSMNIIERNKTNVKFGEYCLLFYSEEKPNYLLNAGYMIEQMDLFLESLNIGTCWYGMGKVKEDRKDNLKFIIMLVFGKCKDNDFRKSIKEFKRYKIEKIWQGEFNNNIKELVRLAPSSCNTQPWKIISNDDLIEIYRDTSIESKSPKEKPFYYNFIDMGILLCFLEIVLIKNNYNYNRILTENIEKKENSKLSKIATYCIISK